MEVLHDNDLAKYLFHKYSLNPKNWNFIISTSKFRDDFFDAIISSHNEVWQLKIDSLYKPTPIILGTKLDTDYSKIEKKIERITSFGYRKLDSNVIIDFLNELSKEQDHNSVKDINFTARFNSLLSSLDPVNPTSGGNYLYGPFNFTAKNVSKLDKHHKHISERLSSQMRDNIRKRYSLYR